VPPQPAEGDGPVDPGAEVAAGATSREEGRVDALDVNPTVLHGLDIVGDLDQLARGDLGIGEGGEAR